MGAQVLRTPARAPTANSFCERFGGTLRRECLDFFIAFNERHLKLVLNTWIAHFNHARPHMSLGPGIPAASRQLAQESTHRHRIPAGHTVRRCRSRRTPSGGLARGNRSVRPKRIFAEHKYAKSADGQRFIFWTLSRLPRKASFTL